MANPEHLEILKQGVKVWNEWRMGEETPDEEPLLEDGEMTTGATKWVVISYILYGLSGLTFVGGIILLLLFCAQNIQNF